MTAIGSQKYCLLRDKKRKPSMSRENEKTNSSLFHLVEYYTAVKSE